MVYCYILSNDGVLTWSFAEGDNYQSQLPNSYPLGPTSEVRRYFYCFYLGYHRMIQN